MHTFFRGLPAYVLGLGGADPAAGVFGQAPLFFAESNLSKHFADDVGPVIKNEIELAFDEEGVGDFSGPTQRQIIPDLVGDERSPVLRAERMRVFPKRVRPFGLDIHKPHRGFVFGD